MVRFFPTLLLFFLLTTPSPAGFCGAKAQKGEVCKIKTSELHPLQFAYGEYNVLEKMQDLDGLGKKKIEKFLKVERIRVVLSPSGEAYIVDGHHHALAADRMNISELYVEVINNFRGYKQEDFEKELIKNKWVRLVDENGLEKTFSELPKKLAGLKDDPYRSLAWALVSSGAVDKTRVPFSEFIWADFLRSRVKPWKGKEEWREAVKSAMKLAWQELDVELPGKVKVRKAKWKKYQNKCEREFAKISVGPEE